MVIQSLVAAPSVSVPVQMGIGEGKTHRSDWPSLFCFKQGKRDPEKSKFMILSTPYKFWAVNPWERSRLLRLCRKWMFLVLRGSLVMLFSWGFPRSLLPFHFYPHSTNVGREKNQKTGPSTSTSAGHVPEAGFPNL